MKSPSLPSCQEGLFLALRGMGYIRFIGLILSLLLGIAGACRAEAAISTNKVVARVFARWLEQEAPQAPAGEGKVARALAAALTKIADGGDINVADKTGHTALMMAAAIDHRPAIDFLLLSGADPYIQNSKGRTALDMAKDDSVRKLMEASALMDKGFTEEELEQCRQKMASLQYAGVNIGQGECFYSTGGKKAKRQSASLDDFLKWKVADEALRETVMYESLGRLSMHSTGSGNPDATLLCLKAGVNPSKEYEFDRDKVLVNTTPLYHSLGNRSGNVRFRMVCQLLAAGADVRKAAPWYISQKKMKTLKPLMVPLYGKERTSVFIEELLLEAGAVEKGDDVAGMMVASGKEFLSKANLMKALYQSEAKMDKLDDEGTVRFYCLVSPWLDKEVLAYLNRQGLKKKALIDPSNDIFNSLASSFNERGDSNPYAFQALLKMGTKPQAVYILKFSVEMEDFDAVVWYCWAHDAKGVKKHIKNLKRVDWEDSAIFSNIIISCLGCDMDINVAKVLMSEKGIFKEKELSEVMHALWRNNKDVVQFLLERTKIKVGDEPCRSITNPEVARLLVKAGAKVKFDSATVCDYPEVAEGLVEAGAIPDDLEAWKSYAASGYTKTKPSRLWYPGETAYQEKLDKVISRIVQMLGN